MSVKIRRALLVGVAVVGGVVVAAVFASLFEPDEEFVEEPTADVDEVDRYEDVIKTPPALGKWTTPLRDIHGDPIGIRCTTCHTDGDEGSPPAQTAGELSEFHTEMEFDHGELKCSSCHASDDRDKLKLADGSSIDFEDTMEQCAQCHSSEYRSYKHGAHGGMKGHWDRSEGPRIRNHCVTCHDPHDPAFPDVTPADPPRDRFFGDR